MPESAVHLIDMIRLGVGGLAAGVGVLLLCGGAIALARFPDLYTRLHAIGADMVGAVFLLAGLSIIAWDAGLSTRLLLLAALIAGLWPTLAQLIANAAHAGGLSPIAGRYVAPRPGRHRAEPGA